MKKYGSLRYQVYRRADLMTQISCQLFVGEKLIAHPKAEGAALGAVARAVRERKDLPSFYSVSFFPVYLFSGDEHQFSGNEHQFRRVDLKNSVQALCYMDYTQKCVY